MPHRSEIEALIKKHGFDDFKWIDPKTIVVAQWVRTKCLYGCGDYGNNATCPPHAPSVAECERFFREYKEAVLFHFVKRLAKPEDRNAWSKTVNGRLVDLEREVFLSGREKAFVLIPDTCNFCGKCPGRRNACKNPLRARPSPDAMAVDVYSTVRAAGYPIQVLPDYDREMNRYGFLLIE
jgi:predicted metal-binding protein